MLEHMFFDEELREDLQDLREEVEPFKNRHLNRPDYSKLRKILSVERQEFLRDRLLAETAHASTALESFTNDHVKHHFFVDKTGRPLFENNFTYKLRLEGRCHSCNHIAVSESQPYKVITDHQLMPYLIRKQLVVKNLLGWELSDSEALKKTAIYPVCESEGCYSKGELTELVTSRNIISLEEDNFFGIQLFSQREKSDGSTRDKFIDFILGMRDTFFDRLAARFVVDNPEDVYRLTKELTKLHPRKISYKPNGVLPDNYEAFLKFHEEKDIPLEFSEERRYKKKEDYFAVHMGVPWSWTVIEVQVKTAVWHHIAEKTDDLEHKRMLERKEERRINEWGNLGFMLREYLTPCFSKYDFLNYLQQ